MLRTYTALKYCPLDAREGEIGAISDVFFDDTDWVIRYFVVTTSGWLLGRRVLISPGFLGAIDPAEGKVAVDLTRDQVKHSPDVNTDRPITRGEELAHHRYYGTPIYWGGFGIDVTPFLIQAGPEKNSDQADEADFPRSEDVDGKGRDSHLRSANDVHGYHVHASDGSIGHVEDFLIESEFWQIQYLVIDTRNWWPGKRVVVPAKAIKNVNWLSGAVATHLTRDQVKQAPEFQPSLFDGAAYHDSIQRYYHDVLLPR